MLHPPLETARLCGNRLQLPFLLVSDPPLLRSTALASTRGGRIGSLISLLNPRIDPIHLPRIGPKSLLMQKRLIVVSAALLIVLSALPLFAANVTGKWTAEAKEPRRQPRYDHLRLQAGRTQLTGTVALSDQTTDVSSGKVDGDKISFAAVFRSARSPTLARPRRRNHDDRQVRQPDLPIHELTLKRSK